MPACGPDWVLVPRTRMSPDALSTIIRELLRQRGIPGDEILNITSHSMKTTFLSWVAKCGLPKSIRRTLGGHTKPKDNMVELYGRDEFAEPLWQLVHVMLWVSEGDFLPDETRSGRWKRHPRNLVKLPMPATSAGDMTRVNAPSEEHLPRSFSPSSAPTRKSQRLSEAVTQHLQIRPPEWLTTSWRF